MKKKHDQEVIDYCSNNKVSFTDGYVAVIEQRLASMDNQLHDLRRDVEFTIEDVQFDDINL